MRGIIVYKRIKKPDRKVVIIGTIYAITYIKFKKKTFVLLLNVAFVSYE